MSLRLIIRELSLCTKAVQSAYVLRRSQNLTKSGISNSLWKRGFQTSTGVYRVPVQSGTTGNASEFILSSPHPDIVIPQKSFTEYAFSLLEEFKDSELVVDMPTGRTYKAKQLKEYTVKVASAVKRMGYGKGDRIIIFAHNCPEYFIFFLACAAVGAVVSPANPVYTKNELINQLRNSGSVAIVAMAELMPVVRETIMSDQTINNQIRDVFVIGQEVGYRSFSDLMEDDGKAFPDNIDIDPKEDMLVLPYSSGTTGLPKGVMLTHRNITANLEQLAGGPMELEAAKDCLVGVLPFYHIYGMTGILLGAVLQGAKVICLRRFQPEMFLEAIQRHKVTYAHLVPPIILFLASSPMVEEYDTHSLKTLVSGAAPLGEALTTKINERLKVETIQAYGMTEASPFVHYDAKPYKHGTIGRIVPNTKVKVISTETGRSLGVDEVGELLIKGPQVMKGYFNNVEATEATVKDGWLHSGDMGYYIKDEHFVVCDRIKELIKYKGFQVAPAELESLILSHPDIQDAAVVGVPVGEELGEVPRAFVVRRPHTNVKATDIERFVAENVSPYKKLRGGVRFIDEIPKTASGKLLRRHLKELVKSL